jgi:hypothetical protein
LKKRLCPVLQGLLRLFFPEEKPVQKEKNYRADNRTDKAG